MPFELWGLSQETAHSFAIVENSASCLQMHFIMRRLEIVWNTFVLMNIICSLCTALCNTAICEKGTNFETTICTSLAESAAFKSTFGRYS